MKKIVFIFICLLMPSLSWAYVDIDNQHWAYDDIVELKNRNIVSGYPDDTFRADNYISEEELITILFNVANAEISEYIINWPQDYINLAEGNGIGVMQNFATKKKIIEVSQKLKNLETINFNGTVFTNRLNELAGFLNERELTNLANNITRAEACVYINNLINMSKTKLPVALENQNDKQLDIKTIINSVEIAKFDSYDGIHKNIISKIKEGGHPYLDFRKKLAEDNYLLIIEFETINNSKYQVPTGYEYLRFDVAKEDISIIDAFDIDEVNLQIQNKAYDGIWVTDNHKSVAFYILNKEPQTLKIYRDINTLYNPQTEAYINVNSVNSAIINL